MNELVQALERQVQFLQRQSGASFLRQLVRWLVLVQRDARVRVHLDDMRGEAIGIFERLWAHDDSAVAEAVRIRDELVAAAPFIDDSHAAYPISDIRSVHSLKVFDEAARETPAPRLSFTGNEDDSRTSRLIRILRTKFQEIDSGPNSLPEPQAERVRAIRETLQRLEEQHEYAIRALINEKLTNAGTSLLRIENEVENINPPPATEGNTFQALLVQVARRMARRGEDLDRVLYDRNAGTDAHAHVEKLAEELKGQVERVHEELRLRIGTRRSLVALLDRYKARCEWHDRARLRKVSSDAGRGAEDALTAEFARWLFDQGLSPLTKPLIAGLQPDLLEPYVEAKRYKGGANDRRHIVQGMWQLHDTVSALRGTPREVAEAFFVVFREDGPRYVLPDTVRGEGWTVFLRLIDIAPAVASGSRQRHQPEAISLEELGPRGARL